MGAAQCVRFRIRFFHGWAVTSPNAVQIIAEAAQGYEGDVNQAEQLVRAAASARADVVKFHIIYADEVSTARYPHYSLFRQLEMPPASWMRVAERARGLGLRIAFDVCGLKSLEAAVQSGASAIKIHTTDFFNEALITAARSHPVDIYFSAGGMTMEEVEGFLGRFGISDRDRVTLFYGYQAEPTQPEDTHLQQLAILRHRFPSLRLGFMDHASGDSDESGWLGVLSLPYGVTAIEKHITLDRSLKLEDYISALDASAFERYVSRIRTAQTALGPSEMRMSDAERLYRRKVVKVVVARNLLKAGQSIQTGDVLLLRTPLEAGRRPLEQIRDVIERQVARDVPEGQPVYQEDLT